MNRRDKAEEFRKSFDDMKSTAPRLTELEKNDADLTSQLAHKAEQEALNAVSSQIDDLIANAIDGNAELLGMRIGWDGTVYETAGEAVRNVLTPFITAENEEWIV